MPPVARNPGLGDVDWSECLGELRRLGYCGSFGMEYVPTTGSAESLAEIRRIVNRLDGSEGFD